VRYLIARRVVRLMYRSRSRIDIEAPYRRVCTLTDDVRSFDPRIELSPLRGSRSGTGDEWEVDVDPAFEVERSPTRCRANLWQGLVAEMVFEATALLVPAAAHSKRRMPTLRAIPIAVIVVMVAEPP
jgi:hypothetical protein